MLIGIVVASIIAYLTALVTIREKQIYQQIVFLLIYIIGMTFIGEMDILLPIYFLVSFFSIVINMNKISYISIVIYAFLDVISFLDYCFKIQLQPVFLLLRNIGNLLFFL